MVFTCSVVKPNTVILQVNSNSSAVSWSLP